MIDFIKTHGAGKPPDESVGSVKREELRTADEDMTLLLIEQLSLLDASAAPILRELIERSSNMTIIKAASKALVAVLT